MRGQHVDAEHGGARGRQLDRERQPVEPATHRCHQREAAFIQRKARIGRTRARREQLHGARVHRIARVGVGVGSGHVERRHRAHALAMDAQRLAAGREHAQPVVGIGQRARDPGGVVEQVFAIVEHEQHPAPRDTGQHGFERQRAGRLRDAERAGKRVGHEVRAGHRGQRYEHRPFREPLFRTRGRLDRDARLADPAGAHQRDDARDLQRGLHVGQHRFAAEQRTGHHGRAQRLRAHRRLGAVPLDHQPVAAARHRHDQVAVGGQRLAQRRDMHLQVVFFNNGMRPDALHDFIFRYQRTVRPNQ